MVLQQRIWYSNNECHAEYYTRPTGRITNLLRDLVSHIINSSKDMYTDTNRGTLFSFRAVEGLEGVSLDAEGLAIPQPCSSPRLDFDVAVKYQSLCPMSLHLSFVPGVGRLRFSSKESVEFSVTTAIPSLHGSVPLLQKSRR